MRLIMMLLLSLYVSAPDLNACRKLLDHSLADEKTANRFYEQLKGVKENDAPVMVGFRAMSEFMICKHLVNPISRLSHFNRGKKLLESAIKRDHHSAELLFFRLSTQSNVPSVLRYNTDISADKQSLISYLKSDLNKPNTDKELHKRIKSYLLVNPFCSAEEKNLIKTL
jgi:hypothetical protein